MSISAHPNEIVFFVYRAEVSQKAVQVDALNDQLSEERKTRRATVSIKRLMALSMKLLTTLIQVEKNEEIMGSSLIF